MVILMDSVVCSCCIGFVKSMLYFIKKYIIVCVIQKLLLLLHAFCMVGTVHLCLRMGVVVRKEA